MFPACFTSPLLIIVTNIVTRRPVGLPGHVKRCVDLYDDSNVGSRGCVGPALYSKTQKTKNTDGSLKGCRKQDRTASGHQGC
jgi:hypothetical protein